MKKMLKKITFLFSLSLLISNCSSQINLNKISNKVKDQIDKTKTVESVNPLTNDEVIKGLKEALSQGIKKGASQASSLDGFLKNDIIRLPFPSDAQKVKEKAIQLGLENKVEKFEEVLNRSAEEAAKEAAPIFLSAIKNMSVQDGFSILKGGDNAATNYLKENTSEKLYNAFFPKVEAAINSVNLTSYWNPLAKSYNKTTFISGNEPINTDLKKYVTDRAISGLFTLIENEEKKIRKDPIARASDILKKVFGSQD